MVHLIVLLLVLEIDEQLLLELKDAVYSILAQVKSTQVLFVAFQ